jgi:hypothetical protein
VGAWFRFELKPLQRVLQAVFLCPEQRSFDVLAPNPSPNFGVATPDEEYVGDVKTGQYASITNDAASNSALTYRTVVDGIALERRRDPGACVTDAPAPASLEERLAEVLGWFGHAEGSICADPTAGTSVELVSTPKPVTTLSNFAPNPLMSSETGKIRFTMAREGNAVVDIFDLNGRKVKTVFDGVASQGPNEVAWNGKDAFSRPVANGVYFYRLRAGNKDFSKKLVVVRSGR